MARKGKGKRSSPNASQDDGNAVYNVSEEEDEPVSSAGEDSDGSTMSNISMDDLRDQLENLALSQMSRSASSAGSAPVSPMSASGNTRSSSEHLPNFDEVDFKAFFDSLAADGTASQNVFDVDFGGLDGDDGSQGAAAAAQLPQALNNTGLTQDPFLNAPINVVDEEDDNGGYDQQQLQQDDEEEEEEDPSVLAAVAETKEKADELTKRVEEAVATGAFDVEFSEEEKDRFRFLIDFQKRIIICNITDEMIQKWNPLKRPRDARFKTQNKKNEADVSATFNKTYGKKLKSAKRTQSNRRATKDRHEFLKTHLQRVVLNQHLMADDVLSLLGMKFAVRYMWAANVSPPSMVFACDVNTAKKRDRHRVNAVDLDPNVTVISDLGNLIRARRVRRRTDRLNTIHDARGGAEDGKGYSLAQIDGEDNFTRRESMLAFNMLFCSLDQAKQRDSIVYALSLLAQYKFGFHLILHEYCLVGFALAAFCHRWQRIDLDVKAKDMGPQYGFPDESVFATYNMTKNTWHFVQNGSIHTLGEMTTKVPVLHHIGMADYIQSMTQCEELSVDLGVDLGAKLVPTFDADPEFQTLYAPSHETLKHINYGEVTEKQPADSECFVLDNGTPRLKNKFGKRRNVLKALLDYIAPSNFATCSTYVQPAFVFNVSDEEDDDGGAGAQGQDQGQGQGPATLPNLQFDTEDEDESP